MIELSPLSGQEVGELAAALLRKDGVSEAFAEQLRERTAGIPFVVEEVTRQLQDELGLGRIDLNLDQLTVPSAIRQPILRRMAELDRDAQEIANVVAVLASPVETALIRKVAGLSEFRASRALTQTLSRAVLEEKGSGLFDFRHPLAAQAVYQAAPTPVRQRLHLRAARVLETSPGPRPFTQLAHHFREGGRPAKSVFYAQAAAEAAISTGDDRGAARILEEALSTPRISREARVRMAIRLGDAALYSVAPQRAIEILGRTLTDEKIPVGLRGELRFSFARLLSHGGDESAWRTETVRAIDELTGRPDLQARAMVNLALPMLTERHMDDHLTWLHRAVHAAERQVDPVARTAVFAQRPAILLSVGDPTGWRALRQIPRHASSADEKLQRLRGYHGVTVAALLLGHHRRAESFLAEAFRIQSQLLHASWQVWLETSDASIRLALGRWDGLEDHVRDLVERTAGIPSLCVCNQSILCSLLLAHGELDEVQCRLESGLEQACGSQVLPNRIALWSKFARIHLLRGDTGAARHVAGLGLDVIRRKGIWVWGKAVVPAAVDAALACGDVADAHQLVREFKAGLQGRDAPASRAALASCRGRLATAGARPVLAARFFTEAERLWSSLPSPYEAAQARERRASALPSDDDKGAELLVDAFETFEGLGASWDAARVRGELAIRGVRLPYPWRGGRKAYGNDLSPREAEVARLAGSGWSNREIARALFISSRTAEKHVAAALRKLGVDSRYALARDDLRNGAKMGSSTTSQAPDGARR